MALRRRSASDGAAQTAELEQGKSVTINLAPGTTYIHHEGKGGETRIILEGKAEVRSPIPIPPPVHLKTALGSLGAGSASLKKGWSQ